MKLLVTGGSGFLGLHLCRTLHKSYEKIIIFDPASIRAEEYPSNVIYQNGDVRDAEALEKSLQGVDDVIHCAAALPLYPPREIYEVNVEGTRNVLQACLKNKIKRFVHISSTAVYGVPEKHPIEETDRMIGVGPYGESKIKAEEICMEYRGKGLCVSILRPKTFVGPERLGVFQILFDWIESGTKIPVIGSGKNLYQLMDVADLCAGVELMLTAAPSQVNDVFNIGAEKFRTVEEDLNELCRYAGGKSRVLGTPSILVKGALRFFEFLRCSPLYKWVYETADKDSFVSVEKLKKLGWSSRYSNSEALIRSYQWYLDHKNELGGEGITHRAAWKQGVLRIIKKVL